MSIPELRQYQKDTIDRVYQAALKGHKKIVIAAMTGAGKTHIISELARRVVSKSKKAVIFAHRRKLVAQISERLNLFGVPHGIVMAGEKLSSAPVQVISRDTLLSRLVEHEWWEHPPEADMVIIDECRHVMSPEYLGLAKMYSEAFHIGMDATPVREDGKGLGDFYTHIVNCAPTSQLIKEGFLVPIRCFSPQDWKGGKRTVSADPVAAWKMHGQDRPTVLFAPKVEISKEVMRQFNEAGITAEHMDAYTPDNEREEIFARIKSGKTKILCNCAILSEGVDIPELSCCQLLKVSSSYSGFIQAVGRVMRSHPSKTDAVLIDHSDAVLEHGFPDEDVEWKLDTSTSVDKQNKKDRKEGAKAEPVICKNCGAFIKAFGSGDIVCPECGNRMVRKRKKVETRPKVLTEVDRQYTPQEVYSSRKKYWLECLYMSARRGQNFWVARAIYRRQYPDDPFFLDYPFVPNIHVRNMKITDIYPGTFNRKW